MEHLVVVLDIDGLQSVADTLTADGFDVVGPEQRDGSIVIGPFRSVDQLPVGVGTELGPGSARLVDRGDRARFGWALGAQAIKPLLHPPRVRTMTFDHGDGSVVVAVEGRPQRPIAVIGLRPCDLAAVQRLDHVLLDSAEAAEPTYLARRADLFTVVVDCHEPASTCFCSSMGTGPGLDDRATGFDIALTELLDADRAAEPRYLARAGSDRGRSVLDRATAGAGEVPLATPADLAAGERARRRAIARIERQLETEPDVLTTAHDDPHWDDVASRCLACANCTAVCPTCFCTSIDDVGDLTGTHVDRWRTWDSCFGLEFSRLGGTIVRPSVAARYRQWLTHKLGWWHDQFGESGCVGCGRCIAWCPVGIDIVHEAAQIGRGTAPGPPVEATEPAEVM